MPLGVEENKPSLFEIVNGAYFPVINYHFNKKTLFLHSKFNKKVGDNDIYLDFGSLPDESLILEVFLSKDGKSNAAMVEVVDNYEKSIDNKIPICMVRILRQTGNSI